MPKLPKFENDSSYKARGGTAKWLVLICAKCKSDICFYQKDGPGNIFRLYLDRIADSGANYLFKNLEENEIQKLTCANCGSIIATPMTYGKDAKPRLALRLIESGVEKIAIKTVEDWDIHKIDLNKTMKCFLVKTKSANQK